VRPEERAEPADNQRVQADHAGGERAVDQRTPDQDVDVEEAVAQDRDADRDRDEQEGDADGRATEFVGECATEFVGERARPAQRREERVQQQDDQQGADRRRHPEDDPLGLLALERPRDAAVAVDLGGVACRRGRRRRRAR